VATLGLFLVAAAHLADYLTFLVMILRHGLAAEANPIVVMIAENHGLALLTTAKAAAVLLVVCTVIIVGRRNPRLAAVTLGIGILTGGFATLSNLLTI
jgi:uncharacterized membrane protein